MATITDSFNRADSSTSLGNADTGQAWQTLGSTVWGISSNRAYPATPGAASDLALQDAGSGEQEVRVDLYGITGAAAGIVFRAADAGNFLLALADAASQTLQFWEYQGGSVVYFEDVLATVADGVELKAVCEGTTVEVYVGGVLALTRTTSRHQAETRCGLWYDGNASARFEDFSAASIDPETFTLAGRGASHVLNTFTPAGRGLSRTGYDSFAGLGRGYFAALAGYSALGRGASHVYNAAGQQGRGIHRVAYDPYAGLGRGAASVYNASVLGGAGLHRVGYDAYSGLGRGEHAVLSGYGQLGRGEHRVVSLSVVRSEGGSHRVANAALARYELYRGVGAAPDLAAVPWQTFLTLPFTTPALAAGNTYRFVLRRRNAWGLVSENLSETTIVVAPGGTQSATPPSAPQDVAAAAAAGRTVRVTAEYDYGADGDNAADLFAVYVRSNGTDPDPAVDSPVEVEAFQADGVAKLDYTAGPFTEGAAVKALVRTRRSGSPDVDSTNADVHGATATDAGPAQVSPAAALVGRVAELAQA